MTQAMTPTWFDAAKAQGLLPAEAEWPQTHSRPWPVVLMTALGAWLAGLPLLGLIGLMFGSLLEDGPAALIIGGLFVAGALALLRSKDLPLFIEQLAVPMMWAGTAAMAWSMGRYMPWSWVCGLLALLVAGQALLLPGPARAWLRLLLGVACVVLLYWALSPLGWMWSGRAEASASELSWLTRSPWWITHLLAAVWLGWAYYKRHVNPQTTRSRAVLELEPFALGWAIAVLLNLVWLSGATFLMPVGSRGGVMDLAGDVLSATAARGYSMHVVLTKTLSVLLAVAAAALLARYFSGLRAQGRTGAQVSSAAYAVGAVLVVLAWLMPTLGAAALLGVTALVTQRQRLAVLAAVVAVWIIGGFYYSLVWPLAHKAALLIAIAALLAALVWWARNAQANGQGVTSALASRGHHGLALTLIALTALLTLGVANTAIWQKERLIAQGQPVYVRLAPVDPRSLMQGDYMALRFTLPNDLRTNAEIDARPLNLRLAQRPRAVGTLDAQNIATLTRIAMPGEPIQSGEIAIELTPKNGDWVLVSDAWFFAEGEAKKWEAARYGEFRVTPDGKALLVGMADEKRVAIKP